MGKIKKCTHLIIIKLKQCLDDINFKLMMMEDYMYGEDGDKITAMRGKIHEVLYYMNKILTKEKICHN